MVQHDNIIIMVQYDNFQNCPFHKGLFLCDTGITFWGVLKFPTQKGWKGMQGVGLILWLNGGMLSSSVGSIFLLF